jgi:hypothetical protein
MKVATRAGVTSSLEAAITSERTDRRGQRNALHKATTKALHNPAHLSHALQSPPTTTFLSTNLLPPFGVQLPLL